MTVGRSPDAATGRRIGRAAVITVLLALATVFAVVLLSGNVYAPVGDTDPGPLTSFGTAGLRLLVTAASAVCVGSLVFAVFLTPPGPDGRLAADGYAALRMAGMAAACWAVGAAALVPFSGADGSGQPVTLRLNRLIVLVDALEEPKAWLITLAVTAVAAVAARIVLSWRSALLLLGFAGFALLPPVITGHVSVGNRHDLATNSIVWHVLAAAVWTGTLVALLAHLRRDGVHQELAARRYHRLATGCWLVLAASGLVNGVIAVDQARWTGGGYGLLVVLKVLLLGALGALILSARARALRSGALLRLGLLELGAMGVTMAISVGLTHLPPPNYAEMASVMHTIIGYELTEAPSLSGLLLGWRFDLVLGTVAVLATVTYLVGLRRLLRRGDHWPVGRTVAWVCGWLAVLIATSSGVGKYSPGTFSMHMIAHMTLNMLAPVLLVLGGPITLALRALPVAGKGNPPGPREWLVSVVQSRFARFAAHPLVASVVFVGSFYLLYFSGLFGAAMPFHWAHQLMNVHFVISGYLFYWLVIGVDRAPRPLPHLARLGMLFAVMPFHAFFGVILMNKQSVIAETFYRYLSLPWVPDLLAEQRLGGGIAWATGEIPLVIVVIALLAQWARHDEREAARADRHADQDGDGDLAAYNEMLAKLAGTRH
ncbi:cytochrome c oxidase assembly protein [Amycolatopsis nigrescens]|uniref:cytochrome c oxidase assembly protein n=1 Tax=Amycolatopsis nigrescens TaxID=381445 RepID=UPI000366D77E|nr:cytochrome c oxidase assembly protein [Amycolatopsis nigrescens]